VIFSDIGEPSQNQFRWPAVADIQAVFLIPDRYRGNNKPITRSSFHFWMQKPQAGRRCDTQQWLQSHNLALTDRQCQKNSSAAIPIQDSTGLFL
jgi:hypothetical protein